MQRLSYISTPKSTPYQYCSVVDAVRENASLRPDQEMFIHRRPNGERYSITNKVLESKSTILANYLNGIGIKRRQYVGLVGSNSLEWIIGELALLKTGAVSVHLSIGASDAKDAMDVIESTSCRYILMDPGVDMMMKTPLQTLQKRINEWNKTNPEQEIQTILLRSCEEFKPFPSLENILKIDMYTSLPILFPESPALVLCTSGSTGKPKLVQMDHFTLVNIGKYVLDDDRGMYYSDRPFAWIGGSPLLYIAGGIPRLFIDSAASTKDIWNLVKEEQCSHAFFVPYELSEICDYVERNTSKDYRLKTIETGGEMIGEICSRALRTICSDSVHIVYGSTETGIASMKTITPHVTFETGDVGSCVPGVEIKIIDKNSDCVLWGSLGEICIRSQFMSQGYLNAPELNKDLFTSDGWIRTGDIGKVTEDGHLTVVGKLKTVISRGTRKLIPSMIEEVIRKIPGLKEVFVILVPDKRLLEEVCVCYVPDSEDDLEPDKMKTLCSKLFFTTETVDGMGEAPTYFVKMNDIPVLDNGKVDKAKLKKIAVAQLRLY